MTQLYGIEIEVTGASKSHIRTHLDLLGVLGAVVKDDATPTVTAEIVLPPLAPSRKSRTYLQTVCSALANAGAQVNMNCGLHVHLSNAPIADRGVISMTELTDLSINAVENTGRYLQGDHLGEPFDVTIVRDVIERYTIAQNIINSFLPPSRRSNRYAQTLERRIALIQAASTISELQSATFGKFSCVNVATWSRGTVEFRQAAGTIEFEKIQSWVDFLLNLFDWTVENRIEQGARQVIEETPDQPFRAGSRLGVIWGACRSVEGATVTDLMNRTGTTAQNIRSRISEFRARFGDAAIVTHTQQQNGHGYGDGVEYARYQILERYTIEQGGARLLPENRIGIASIWAGLSDEAFEYWQNRIAAFA
jgi:hypothetical protein